jgi:hypothetical protein
VTSSEAQKALTPVWVVVGLAMGPARQIPASWPIWIDRLAATLESQTERFSVTPGRSLITAVEFQTAPPPRAA